MTSRPLTSRPGSGIARRVVAATLAGALLVACSDRAPGDGHGVLLVAIDALRADHLSGNGYDRETSPRLDELAREGTTFTRAFSTAPALIPAHVTLLTGCHPAIARLRVPRALDVPEYARWSVPHRAPRLAMQMLAGAEEGGYRASGFATAAFIDTTVLSPTGGYAAGFQEYRADAVTDLRSRDERGAEALTGALADWVRDLPDDRSWFGYLHLHDLERSWGGRDAEWADFFEPRRELDQAPAVSGLSDPFFALPRSRWAARGTSLGTYEARYDGAIRGVDQALGDLFGELAALGRWSRTTVVVLGTYGLQFGESGLILDAGLLSVADLRVPLIVRPAPDLPVEVVRGGSTEALVSLVDVAPTILELSGLAVPSGMHGRSLVSLLEGAEDRPHEHVFASCGRIGGAVAFGPRWAFEHRVFDPEDRSLLARWFGTPHPRVPLERSILYDWHATPAPALWGPDEVADPVAAERLRQALDEWQLRVFGTWAVLQEAPQLRSPGAAEQLVIDRLEELGYLGAEQ